MVGREAIHAAMNPVAGSSLYFVARGDGSHVFSNDLDAHNAAVKEYQLKRRTDYRSSPAPIVTPAPVVDPAVPAVPTAPAQTTTPDTDSGMPASSASDQQAEKTSTTDDNSDNRQDSGETPQ
jgi:UPF0755 protein